MGKYLRKCKGIEEIATMETAQAAGVRTRARSLALAAAASSTTRGPNKAGAGRSSRRRKAAGAVSAELGASYLELRSRSVFLRSPAARSTASSVGPTRSVSDIGRISQCSSSASLEAGPSRTSGPRELAEEFDTTTSSDTSRRASRTETRDEASDLESTVEVEPARRSTSAGTTTMPSAAEIEDFFTAAERDQRRRFADKYNYDVINDVPLVAGRYEWVPFAR